MKSPNATTYVFSQLIDLLLRMSEHEYVKPIKLCKGSTIGMHVRHILELYQCLIRDYDSATVDYDNRVRNQLMENNIAYAISIAEDLQKRLESLPNDKVLKIVDRQTSQTENVVTCVGSSLQRELLYQMEHCIHHMAIIGICVRAEFGHILLDDDFGKAYATISYEKSKICVQ